MSMTRDEFTANIAALICEMTIAGDCPVGDRWMCSSQEQNRLFKIGRQLINDIWQIIGDVVTFVDGIIKLSKHQHGIALDIYLKNKPTNEIVYDVLRPGNEHFKERMLYWHSIWDKQYGGKPMIDKPNFRDFPHFEG